MSLTHAKKTKKPAEAFCWRVILYSMDFMLQDKTVNHFASRSRWP
ncbi:hypothetical protein [Klebsiella pneumoniae IS46]|nr:hypothetical protein [Klebsiella pneumoniae IS46]